MTESLKTQTIKGVGWSAIERFSSQGIQFVIQIILARLLVPADYGIVGIMVVFLLISQVFIDSGFANALIKKQECTEKDYSTVFWYNLIVSVTLYCIIFIFAPHLASFYKMPLLKGVSRLLGLSLIFNSLMIVSKTILVKNVNFKDQTKVTLFSVIVSGVIGIMLAYNGFGVWSLCWQTIINNFLQCLFYAIIVKWYPRLIFDVNSFKELFTFGGNLLLSSLINTVFKNLYPLVIGKYFSAKELGCFTRADQFAQFPSYNIGSIIIRVVYPIFSKIQNDDIRLIDSYRKIICLSSFLIFPLMMVLCALAKPIVIIALTEKWSGAVILLQVLCLDWMFDHICGLNLNILYVKNRTDLVLRLEVIKKTIAVLILIFTIPYGMIVICWGRVAYSLIATYINCYYTKKLLDLKFVQQIKDISTPLIASIILYLIIASTAFLFENIYVQLIIGLFVAMLIYSSLIIYLYKNGRLEMLNNVFIFKKSKY